MSDETIEGLSKDIKYLTKGVDNIHESTREIFNKLNAMAPLPVRIENVEDKIDTHVSNHWKAYALLISGCGLIVTIAGIIIAKAL
jgi:hypothetical protein